MKLKGLTIFLVLLGIFIQGGCGFHFAFPNDESSRDSSISARIGASIIGEDSGIIERPNYGSAEKADSDKKFVGSIKSNKYHYPSCRYVEKILPENEIWFSSSEDARSQGYEPCKVCNPP